MHPRVFANMRTQRFASGSRNQIRKTTFFLGLRSFDARPHCHYGSQTRTIITPLLTPPLRGLEMKCQNPKAERDHNKLIINRKCLHYGLKDRRECSLVTALTQIHAFLQGLGRAGSPPGGLCSPAPASAQRHCSGYSCGVDGIWGSLKRGSTVLDV